MTFRAKTQIGPFPQGATFTDAEVPNHANLLSSGLIEEVGDSDAPKQEAEPKDGPKLSEARKEAKEQRERAEKAEASLAEATAQFAKVKAYVDTLDEKGKKAFQDAVNG